MQEVDVRSDLSPWGQTKPEEVPGCACCECFHLLCICVQCTFPCAVFMCPFVWGLAAPSLTTFLCFPPSRLRAALFPTVFHRIFANGESSLCPTWGSVCAPSAPCAAAQCMQSWEQGLVPFVPCLILPA